MQDSEQIPSFSSRLHIILYIFCSPFFPSSICFQFPDNLSLNSGFNSNPQHPFALCPGYFLSFLKFQIHKKGLLIETAHLLGPSHIHSVVKYLCNTYYMLGALLGAGVKEVEETDKKHLLQQSSLALGDRQVPEPAVLRPDASFPHHPLWLLWEAG